MSNELSDAEKVLVIRKKTGLGQEEFASRLGFGQSTISRIEKGGRQVSKRLLAAICREFSVSIRWWETGDGEILETPVVDPLTHVMMDILQNASPVDRAEYLHAVMKLKQEKDSEK